MTDTSKTSADIIYIDPEEDTVCVGRHWAEENCWDNGGVKYIRYDEISTFVMLNAVEILSQGELEQLNMLLSKLDRKD